MAGSTQIVGTFQMVPMWKPRVGSTWEAGPVQGHVWEFGINGGGSGAAGGQRAQLGGTSSGFRSGCCQRAVRKGSGLLLGEVSRHQWLGGGGSVKRVNQTVHLYDSKKGGVCALSLRG